MRKADRLVLLVLLHLNTYLVRGDAPTGALQLGKGTQPCHLVPSRSQLVERDCNVTMPSDAGRLPVSAIASAPSAGAGPTVAPRLPPTLQPFEDAAEAVSKKPYLSWSSATPAPSLQPSDTAGGYPTAAECHAHHRFHRQNFLTAVVSLQECCP